MTRRVLGSVALLLALATPAAADDVVAYQTDGNAPASAADARTMALDEAFAKAATNALSDLVASDVRTARKGELDKEIVARARLWVAKFTVTKDDTVDDSRELSVSVRIDRDRIRARLGELGIALREVPGAPGGEPVVPTKTATILLRVVSQTGTRADYGQAADPALSGLEQVAKLLRMQGYAVRRAPASGTVRPDGDLPLADDEADALANEAKADTYAIAGVAIGPAVPVRGVATQASLVTAHVRVAERKDHRVIGQGSGAAAAAGEDTGYAIDRALAAAMADVMPPAPAKLAQAGAFQGDDTPLPDTGVVLVRLPAKTPFATVLLAQKYIAGAKGVRAATLRRLSPGGWVLGVTTSEPIEQVARIVKKAPSTDLQASVKTVDGIVELSLTGVP